MDEKIHFAPLMFETGEDVIDGRNILDVARQHETRPNS